jgi:phosphatidylglycerophosphatase A
MLLGAFIGGWEVILILVVVLILFIGVSQIRNGANPDISQDLQGRFSLRVFVAQGFGVGKIPVAPGTFGSFVALLWFALLVWTGNFWTYLTCAIQGIAFSLWLCDDAEKILGEEDPSSVVLDEIAAIPFCFLPWIASEWWRNDALPPISHFFSGPALWMTLGIVMLFRVFDIWKPWPVRQSQRLPGGWGVTVDDLLAAVYVALISIPFVAWLT